MFRAGVDFGRGITKAHLVGGRRIDFPSVVGRGVEARYGTALGALDADGRVRVRHVKADGFEIVVDRMLGQSAIEQSDTARADLSRIRQDEDVVALVAGALLRLGARGKGYIVVGAPVDHYRDVRTRWHAVCSDAESVQVLDDVTFEGDPFRISSLGTCREGQLVDLVGTVQRVDEKYTDRGKCIETVYTLDDGTGSVDVHVPAPLHFSQPQGREVWVVARAHRMGRYRDLLVGRWDINGEVLEILDAVVLPEPMGTFFSLALGWRGTIRDRALLAQKVGIVDVGMYTTDCVVVSERRFLDPLSFSIPVGVSHLLEQVRKALSEGYGVDVAPFRLFEELADRAAMVSGLHVDLTEIVDGAIVGLAEMLVSWIVARWENVLGLDRFVLTGGGAHYLYDEFLLRWPQCERPSGPEQLNCDGFAKYADWHPGWGGN